ncbi:MAG: peptidylprolyl isomerase [Rikenellaceae bacterium]
MIKRSLLPLLMIAISAIVVVAQPQRVILDKVVAIVGGSSILYSDVSEYADHLVAQRRSQGYTSDRNPMNEALETLMSQSLLYNQALVDSIEINTGDIAVNVENMVNQMADEAGGIRELEKQHNMAIFNIKASMRQRYEEQYYAQAMRQEIVGKVKVIPGEVEQFYNNKSKDSLPTIGEQYVYAHITKLPSSIDEAKRRVRTRLLEMRQRVISGETRFDALARMYSVDPGSAYRGGEMDPQNASAFVAPFAEALEQLQVGQVSEVVETEFGFHIIELIDKRGDLYHCRHILLRPVFTYDELNEPTKFLDSLASVIKSDSITFEAAAKQHSDDTASKMNGGIVSNHDLLERYGMHDAKMTVTKFLKEDFGNRGFKSIDDYMALSKLKVGEISSPFSTEDLVGNQLSKIVKLVEVIPPHRASLTEDYLRIEEMALVDKQNRVFDEWFSKRIDAMYVYIAPEFRDGEFENKNWLK